MHLAVNSSATTPASSSRTRRSRVPADASSSASTLRVAQPSHATPERSPIRAPVSVRQPWSRSPSSASGPTRCVVEAHRAEIPAVGGAHPFGGDAGGRHREHEHRQALAAGRRRVGAGNGAAPVGLVRAGDQHLLAGEHEAGMVGAGLGDGGGRDVGEVAARAGLGVGDARGDGAGDRRAHDPVELLRCAEGDEGGPQEVRRGVDQRTVVVRRLVAHDRIPAGRAAAATQLLGQADAEEPGLAGAVQDRGSNSSSRPVRSWGSRWPSVRGGASTARRKARTCSRNSVCSGPNSGSTGARTAAGLSVRGAARGRAGRRGCAGSRWCRRRWW